MKKGNVQQVNEAGKLEIYKKVEGSCAFTHIITRIGSSIIWLSISKVHTINIKKIEELDILMF